MWNKSEFSSDLLDVDQIYNVVLFQMVKVI